MSCLQDVPFRMTISIVDNFMEEANFVSAPEFEMSNCADVLMCAMHDFSLEKKVLYWIDSASRQETFWHKATTSVVPTAPPYWLLLVDSKENLPGHHEPTATKPQNVMPIQRCVNLRAAAENLSCTTNKGQLTKKVNRGQHLEEQEDSEGEESSSSTSTESSTEDKPFSDAKHIPGALPQFLRLLLCRPMTSMVLLAAPLESRGQKPPLVKQRQSILLFNNVKDEFEGAKKKLTAFVLPVNPRAREATLASRAFCLHQHSRSNQNLRYRPASDVSLVGTLTPTPPPTYCNLRPLTMAGLVPPTQKHKPTVAVRKSPPLSVPSPFHNLKLHDFKLFELKSKRGKKKGPIMR
ncbi:ubiquitin-associated protein 1-like [Rhineura floridana]|uniref:ubiquitin-associated protein 1-like n=1 Tax=Rhineura floridana TaxID=261503 RepID=UPI002AC85E50|nr:ubiquitin-associated protein 1-like [Rhineura floridana]XP_061451960.1 ubiquitin-associated protein 1-like [Rhineura floridana]